MDKEKFEQAKETLRKLFAIQQSHIRQTENKTETDNAICKKLDGLIAEAATDLLDAYDDCKEKPPKSEMPSNCKQEKTLPENIDKIIEKAIEEAEAELTDSKTFAAIVFRVD